MLFIDFIAWRNITPIHATSCDKTIFMLNSIKHDINPAHNVKMPTIVLEELIQNLRVLKQKRHFIFQHLSFCKELNFRPI